MSASERPERTLRLRTLLALEVFRTADDLQRRRDLLVEIWGAQRARAPMLDTVFARYRSLAMGELLLLDVDEILAVERFYRELDELRFYLAHTEDMPRALAVVLDSSLVRLRAAAREARAALGVALPEWEGGWLPWDTRRGAPDQQGALRFGEE